MPAASLNARFSPLFALAVCLAVRLAAEPLTVRAFEDQSANPDFSATKLSDRSDDEVFLAKYDRPGKLAWIQTAGGKGYDSSHGIAVGSKAK